MKKVFNYINNNLATILASLVLFVGTTAATTTSVFYIQQPECPKELLK